MGCPRSPQPPLPCGVVRPGEVQQGLFIIQTAVQVLLADGTVCTPGAECTNEFAECDVELGEVPVGEVRREVVTVRDTAGFGANVSDARIEGDCPDVYIEGGPELLDDGTTLITVVVNATRTGGCRSELVIQASGANTDANGEFRVEVVAARVQGVEEGCSVDTACCCDDIGRTLPDCGEDDRLSCSQGGLFFTDRCDAQCDAPDASAWMRSYRDDTFLAGPVRVDDDVVVLRPAPCTLERLTSGGASVWETPLSLAVCEDVALMGESTTLMVTGDGVEAFVDATVGAEIDARENVGRTVVTATPDGAVTASRRGGDVIVRALDIDGTLTSTTELIGLVPNVAFQHFVSALPSGDVVLAFVRRAGALSLEMLTVDGGTVTLDDADYTAVVQVDAAGLVRRAFVLPGAAVANMDARGEAYVVCGGTQNTGALVALGGETLAEYDAARSFLLHVDAAGDVAFETDPNSNVYAACSIDESGELVVLATSNTSFFVRFGPIEQTLMLGSAFAWGALVDAASIVIVGSHGGIEGQEVQPLYPPTSTPFESGSFVHRVPRDDLGF